MGMQVDIGPVGTAAAEPDAATAAGASAAGSSRDDVGRGGGDGVRGSGATTS